MWYRMEGNTRKCTCGGVANEWARFAGAKPFIRVSICPTCHPQLEDYVSRQPSIHRQHERVGDGDQTVS